MNQIELCLRQHIALHHLPGSLQSGLALRLNCPRNCIAISKHDMPRHSKRTCLSYAWCLHMCTLYCFVVQFHTIHWYAQCQPVATSTIPSFSRVLLSMPVPISPATQIPRLFTFFNSTSSTFNSTSSTFNAGSTYSTTTVPFAPGSLMPGQACLWQNYLPCEDDLYCNVTRPADEFGICTPKFCSIFFDPCQGQRGVVEATWMQLMSTAILPIAQSPSIHLNLHLAHVSKLLKKNFCVNLLFLPRFATWDHAAIQITLRYLLVMFLGYAHLFPVPVNVTPLSLFLLGLTNPRLNFRFFWFHQLPLCLSSVSKEDCYLSSIMRS